MTSQTVELKEAFKMHLAVTAYRDMAYKNLMLQLNTKASAILKDDLGSQFVMNCGRDIAGEVVRNYFNTSNYNITVDQLTKRILGFTYENEYDPLAQNGGDAKIENDEALLNSLDEITEKLEGKIDEKIDDIFDINESEIDQLAENNDDSVSQSEESEEKSGVVRDCFFQKGREKLTDYLAENERIAKVLDSTGSISEMINNYKKCENEKTKHESLDHIVDIVCKQLEQSENKQDLINEGILNQDGTVSKFMKEKFGRYVQKTHNNKEKSSTKEKQNDKTEEGKGSKSSAAKVIAGQIIYYAAPPLVYELRSMLKDKKLTLSNVFKGLKDSLKNIIEYVCSKLKRVFKEYIYNTVKNFVKSFMELLIELVKSVVKKLLKIAKKLVYAVVDAVRIIADKNATAAEKADSVFNLFGMTVTNCVLEVLFEAAEKAFGIPEFLLAPLQILMSVICTNLTMLILQKVDLFNVRVGFKIAAINKLFDEGRKAYDEEITAAEGYAYNYIQELIESARQECFNIYESLKQLDPHKESVRNQLEGINRMFGMEIDFDKEWMKFIGIEEFDQQIFG